MRRTTFAALFLALALASGGCFAGGGPGGFTPRPLREASAFSGPGPYAAGVTTLHLADRDVEVWYPAYRWSTRGVPQDTYYIRDWLPSALQAILPADINPPFVTDAYRDVPAAYGHFPLVLFSHGYSGYRDQSTFLTTHLAQWGFVVASPDFLERGLASVLGQQPAHPLTSDQVLDETLALVKQADAVPGLLHDRVRTDRVAAVGHSAGGYASTEFASQPEVAGWISLSAGANPGTTLPDKPSLWMVGTNDGVVDPASVVTAYQEASAPTRLVEIGGTGHLNAFSDICEIGEGGGGIVAIALKAGLPIPPQLVKLGTDGCNPPNLPSTQVWPVTRHFVTAELFRIFGARLQVGLGDGVAGAFAPAPVTYLQNPDLP